MILVTGATGQIGSESIRLMSDKGASVRAFVRDTNKAKQIFDENKVSIFEGDFERKDTIDRAMDSIDTLLLITPAIVSQEIEIIDSAVKQGVKHIIKITNHKATEDSPVERRRDHGKVEAYLKNTGVHYTLLAPNFLMQNLKYLAPEIKENHSFTMSAGDGRIGMIDSKDVSAVAATIAMQPHLHENKTYLLTGPKLVDYYEVADELSGLLGYKIDYNNISLDEHLDILLKQGIPEVVAKSNIQVFDLFSKGDGEWLSTTVEDITSHKPRNLHQFLAENIDQFK